MWPSIVFQPPHLAKSLVGAKAWTSVDALPDSERVEYEDEIALMEVPPVRDLERQKAVIAEWEEFADNQ